MSNIPNISVAKEISGVLLLDKQAGITSNHALQLVKKLFNRLFNQKIKAGHTGSLDPLATGILPICIGEATKFSRFLLNADKKYIVTMQLGIQTDTGDIDGNIINQSNDAESLNKILNLDRLTTIKVLNSFIGRYNQVPPIYSAIKKNGVPYYKLARAAKYSGEDLQQISKPMARPVEIYEIRLLSICSVNQLIKLQVHCSKGTYIRSLVEDIAAKLNCLAAVKQLRRISIGDFLEQDLVSWSELERYQDQHYGIDDSKKKVLSRLLALEDCLASFKTVKIPSNLVIKLQNGQAVGIDNNLNWQLEPKIPICIMEENNNKLIGIGELTADNQLIPKRLLKLA